MNWLARLLAGLFGRPATTPPRPTPTSPVPSPAPTPTIPLSPVTLVRSVGQSGPQVMVTRRGDAPDLFVRHVLSDGSYGLDAAGKRGALLYADVPSVPISIQPGSVIEWRYTTTDPDDPASWQTAGRY